MNWLNKKENIIRKSQFQSVQFQFSRFGHVARQCRGKATPYEFAPALTNETVSKNYFEYNFVSFDLGG